MMDILSCIDRKGVGEMASLVRYYVEVTGNVQGVGLRMFVQQRAIELKVTGWIRNMEDGSVHMELQGESSAIDTMSSRIREGNYFIRVKKISMEKRDVIPDEKKFDILY